MAVVTRQDVIARAHNIFPQLGYIWGGWAGSPKKCKMGADGRGVLSSDGPYIASDCSGFTSWCWSVRSRWVSGDWGPNGVLGGANYRPRTGNGNTYESIFIGISAGDVLWRSGHVALYIGNNQVMQLSTQNWLATDTQRGAKLSTNDFNFNGFTSFDGEFAVDYDPDETDIDTDNVSDGEEGPPPNPTPPGDVSDNGLFYLLSIEQYTKRYPLMKAYRRIK